MSRLSCVHVQTFVRSCPDFRAFMFRLSCVHVQTFSRSCPDFRAFDRLSCVHVQTFVRFLMLPDYVILNARRPPRAFIFGLDILASVWDLNLGYDVPYLSTSLRTDQVHMQSLLWFFSPMQFFIQVLEVWQVFATHAI